jgi:Lon protease-like protein
MSRQLEIATLGHRGLPVLALPEYVLFPYTLVPFHVFEARYREMLDECVAGERLLVVAGLRPGWEHAPPTAPPLFEVAGLGRILSERRFPDGRYNVFVHCLERVRITGMGRRSPYLCVDVEVFDDTTALGDPEALTILHQRVLGLASRLVLELGEEGDALRKLLVSTEDPTVLSHRLGAVVVEDPLERQGLLEMASVVDRFEVLADRLGQMLMRLGPSAPPADGWVN